MAADAPCGTKISLIIVLGWLVCIMLSLNFCMVGSPIHLIVRLLINWIPTCMCSQMKYCSKSHLKIISNVLNERKVLSQHQWAFTSRAWKYLCWNLDFCDGPSVAMYTHHSNVPRHEKNMSLQKYVYKVIHFNDFFHWCILWIVDLQCNMYF